MGVIWLLAILAAFAVTAQAQTAPVLSYSGFSGEDIINRCGTMPAKDQQLGAAVEVFRTECLAYIRGFLDGYSVAANSKDAAFCLPDGVSPGQMAKVIIKFGADHPEKLWMKANEFTLLALKGAYPCRAR